MSIKSDYESIFNRDNLKDIYLNEIASGATTGVDNLTPRKFEESLDEHLDIIINKIDSNKYKFTRYKLKLASKGRKKHPREISIPTVRDRIVLKAINKFITLRLGHKLYLETAQRATKEIKQEIILSRYDSIIKIDIQDFYPSIRHKNLEKRLNRFLRNTPNVIDLIMSAVTTPTGEKHEEKPRCGVPQGLSISNTLANLYFNNIDNQLKNNESIKYFRYVDDLLILCDNGSINGISEMVGKRCKKEGLKPHLPNAGEEKSYSGSLHDEFGYLGYLFNPKSIGQGVPITKLAEEKRPIVSVRNPTVQKLINSLVGLFTAYSMAKYKSIDHLKLNVDLRITGCVWESKFKGWLFFFSEIDDLNLLYFLDDIVENLKSRFNIQFNQKRFVRTYSEIKHKRYISNYIPNFDEYSIEEMKTYILIKRPTMPTHLISDIDIRKIFNGLISKQVKDLETDLSGISSTK